MPTFARLTARASAWSGSPAALATFTAMALTWAAWGVLSGGSELWSGVGGGFTGWAALILLVLLQASTAAQTAAILAMLAELVRAVDKADDRVIPADACERTMMVEDVPDGV